MFNTPARQSLRHRAARAASVAQRSPMSSAMITHGAIAPHPAGSQGVQLHHNNIVSNRPARHTTFFRPVAANAMSVLTRFADSGVKRYHFGGPKNP